MFFNPEDVIEEDFLLNFVVSERGAGKTFSTLKWCIQDFIDNGNEFVYMRRTQTELDMATPSMFTALKAEGLFEDHKFYVQNGFMYCDKKTMGSVISISTAHKMKSVAFPKVTTIIFDEFISESKTYLKEEVNKFLSAIETIARMREIRIICLANQNTIYNPYYVYFDVKPHSETTYKTRFRNKSIMVYQFQSEEYKTAKLNTRFGNLIKNTQYGDFMLNNKNIVDDVSFVDNSKGKKVAFAALLIEGNIICSYDVFDTECGSRYLFFKIRDKGFDGKKVLNFDKQFKEGTSLQIIRNNPIYKRMRAYMQDGKVKFGSAHCKQILESLIF